MCKGAIYSKNYCMLMVVLKNTMEYLCFYKEIKCAVELCASDFFYNLIKKCRGPPYAQNFKI